MFRTGNPALKESTFRGVTRAVGEEAMTLQGTVNKTGISLLILLAAAAFVWNSPVPHRWHDVMSLREFIAELARRPV